MKKAKTEATKVDGGAKEDEGAKVGRCMLTPD